MNIGNDGSFFLIYLLEAAIMKCTYSKNHKMEQEEKILVVLLLVVMNNNSVAIVVMKI